jgi:DNA-binding CsgD family transcriptional regulator
MALLDESRRCIEVNGAMLKMLGHDRDAIVGHPTRDFVKGGPMLTDREWQSMLRGGDFFGTGELVASDETTVAVHYAAHPEMVTGRRLILFVTLDSARHGRFRKSRGDHPREELTEREREVVHLVALGHTAREIADELHIAHDTARTHVRNAQEKLGARSRAQLVAIALGEGHTAAA